MKKSLLSFCILFPLVSAAQKDKNNTLYLSTVRTDPITRRAFSRDDFIFIPRTDYLKLEKIVPGMREAKHVKRFYRILSRKLLHLLSPYTVVIDRRVVPDHPQHIVVYIDNKRLLLVRNSQLTELFLSLAT